MPGCARPVGYVPRQTHECDAAVLVRRHLAEFLGRCEERAGPLPAFVKGELEGFAGCGDFELGFVRTCCRSCGDELRVPFSCKSRGCCPSCMGRRMAVVDDSGEPHAWTECRTDNNKTALDPACKLVG